MTFWKSFERLLPARLRRTVELRPEEYVAHFARIAEDDPALKALLEFGRYKFAALAADSTDATQPMERRFEAFQRALNLAQFLEDVEHERAVARARFAEFQAQQQQTARSR